VATVIDPPPTNSARQPILEPISGAEVVVRMLLRHGVDTLFAYPGGFSMPLHQALTRFRGQIRVVLPRHEQGGGFAAQGYARATGKPGVCMATSGPGATNLITAIADAKLDSIPLIAITGQVPTSVIGCDAFQETPIVEVCRSITKHHYLVTDVRDLTRVLREAFHVATTGRPGPVLIDLPKSVQVAQVVPDFDAPMNLPGYRAEPPRVDPHQIDAVARVIQHARRPVICAGGGIISAGAEGELLQMVEKTGIPVTTTLMGLGGFPGEHPLSLDMLGMHGSVYANYAVSQCDLLLAVGVRFSDRATGKVSTFAGRATIVHIDLDDSEIHKNKHADIALHADAKEALAALNRIVERPEDLAPWYKRIAAWKQANPLDYDHNATGILPQQAIQELWRLTRDRDAIIATGVGQHQMWTAQFYKFRRPRTLLSSGGLGTMGFGLPAAMVA
jgi:acetolactate synthase-1/2/3 large subunit